MDCAPYTIQETFVCHRNGRPLCSANHPRTPRANQLPKPHYDTARQPGLDLASAVANPLDRAAHRSERRLSVSLPLNVEPVPRSRVRRTRQGIRSRLLGGGEPDPAPGDLRPSLGVHPPGRVNLRREVVVIAPSSRWAPFSDGHRRCGGVRRRNDRSARWPGRARWSSGPGRQCGRLRATA